MNLASVLKSDEQEYLGKPATGNSAAWCPDKPQSSQSILVRQAVTLPSGISHREVKPVTLKLLWVDMITNAVIVIVIASVSYFFISARSSRIVIETSSVASDSEPFNLR
jgi:hypothetical protein